MPLKHSTEIRKIIASFSAKEIRAVLKDNGLAVNTISIIALRNKLYMAIVNGKIAIESISRLIT